MRYHLAYFVANFFAYLPFKWVNAAKVLLSYYVGKSRGTGVPWGLPISVAVEPTTSCNLRCPECPSGLRSFTRPTGMLKEEKYQKLINEIQHHTAFLTFYFQGEPYLNPHFLEMVRYAADKRIFTSTSTNAHYLTPEMAVKTVKSGIKRVVISIDGVNQQSYEQYRVGGNLDKVLEGTRNLIKARKEHGSLFPYIVFQFLVVKPNEHQIQEVKNMAKALGVDKVWFKTAQLYDFENGNELMPQNPKYSRYKKKEDGTYAIKNKLENKCWKLWHSCVFTWDGQVLPCCFDKDGHYKMGDVSKDAFDVIWQGNKYREFRQKLLAGRKEIDICTNCSEGTTVFEN